MGLWNGGEFAIATKFGLQDRSSVLYVNSELFDSAESCKMAMRDGFKGSASRRTDYPISSVANDMIPTLSAKSAIAESSPARSEWILLKTG